MQKQHKERSQQQNKRMHTAWNNILYTYKVDIVFVLFLREYFHILQMITFCFFLDFHTQSKPL